MLRYKKYTFASISTGTESLTDLLTGAAGKNRRIVSLSSPQTASLYIRVYRDADQIVDHPCNQLTSAAPKLPMDLKVDEGQLVKAGFYNNTGSGQTPEIVIGYEETG